MFFTCNDYKKIRDWLAINGIKDSQFKSTDFVKLNDELVFLQDKINKRTPMSVLLGFFIDHIPIISKKFIDDLIAGIVGIPDKEWSSDPDYPDYPYPGVDPEPTPDECGCEAIPDYILNVIFDNSWEYPDAGESDCDCSPLDYGELEVILK